MADKTIPTCCEMMLDGCTHDVECVGAGGASGDYCYVCGPCMNGSNEPEAFVPLHDVAVLP